MSIASNRSFPIALSLSSAGHALVFLLASLFLTLEFEPSIYNRLLTLTIEATVHEDGLSSAEELAAGAATDSPAAPAASAQPEPSPEPVQRIAEPAPPPAPVAVEVTPPVALASAPEPAPVEIDTPVTDLTGGAAPTEPAVPVVATVAKSDVSIAPVPPEPAPAVTATVALAPKERKMVQRRLERLEKQIGQMPADAEPFTWKHRGKEYTARVRRQQARDNMDIERVVIEVSKEDNGTRLSTALKMRRLAFSNFAQFVSRWDPEVQIHNDEMDGRFHSNTEFNLFSSRKVRPKFYGKVTTAAGSVKMTNNRRPLRREQVFLGGLETGVRTIRLPERFLPFPENQHVDEELIHRFSRHTRVTFYVDGTYSWAALDDGSLEQRRTIDDNIYLLADRKARLHVKGTVRGRVLVYSPERLVIEGDLLYARHPDEYPDSRDYLGLVSDRDVVIAGSDVTGDGDLHIHGSIYAKRRLRVKGYSRQNDALLAIFGSISAGTLAATEPRFRTRITFDKRLEKLRPPGFPMTSRYEIESWDGEWSATPTPP